MSKEVEITISEMRLNGTAAIRIMKCLKEHEPEIWDELKEVLKQKLPIHNVVGQSEQYCECDWFAEGEPEHLNSYLVCRHCDKPL